MQPWERRLADLAHILGTCHATYMEPNLFRMNTNQFLQTSRTVTFLIHKSKASIPSFEEWHKAEIVDAWRGDAVMTWAKESRNVVEKEGDLELHSTLRCSLIASYLSEQDIEVKFERADLRDAGVKKLVRLARRQMPTGISDAAVVKVERRWVTKSLESWELLHALTYVYSRIYEVCRSLADHLKTRLDEKTPEPAQFERLRDEAQHIEYFKATDLRSNSFSVKTRTIRREDKQRLPGEIREVLDRITSEVQTDETMDSTCRKLATMAEGTFLYWGNHVPMLFFYDSDWNVIDMVSTAFNDQAEKYIFWRRMSERVATNRAHGMGWISESWLREMKGYPSTAMRNLQITGEQLHVVLADKSGAVQSVTWEIARSQLDGKPSLNRLQDGNKFGAMPNYFVPVRRVWGLPDGEIL